MAYMDKRLERRVPTTALAISIVGDGQCIYGYARDISRSGMQIRTFSLCGPLHKDVGDQVSIRFRLPHKDHTLKCRATIMWNNAPPEGSGALTLQGVRFTDIAPSEKLEIDSWITRYLPHPTEAPHQELS